jgi:hypothetical protein
MSDQSNTSTWTLRTERLDPLTADDLKKLFLASQEENERLSSDTMIRDELNQMRQNRLAHNAEVDRLLSQIERQQRSLPYFLLGGLAIGLLLGGGLFWICT